MHEVRVHGVGMGVGVHGRRMHRVEVHEVGVHGQEAGVAGCEGRGIRGR